MFGHAYNNYLTLAFPHDELLPLECKGTDSLGGYSLTLVDSLDTLAVLTDCYIFDIKQGQILGFRKEFEFAVEWISEHLSFHLDRNVSVFETNIRILGGLLSGHLLATHPNTRIENYGGKLLTKAIDLGDRLLKAFETQNGIPYQEVVNFEITVLWETRFLLG
jgi:mannosidase alpha-like ER degradation enhancer 2